MRDIKELTKKGIFSENQLKDIQKQQQNGKVKMITANLSNPERIKDEIFIKLYANYQIPAVEVHYFHVAVESRSFDSGTGERISVSKVLALNPSMFKSMEESGYFKGQVTRILHNPTLK